jgi:hypothetical protein
MIAHCEKTVPFLALFVRTCCSPWVPAHYVSLFPRVFCFLSPSSYSRLLMCLRTSPFTNSLSPVPRLPTPNPFPSAAIPEFSNLGHSCKCWSGLH